MTHLAVVEEEVNFVEIAIGSRYFEQALVIYSDSFPQNERQPLSVVRERVRAGKEKMIVCLLGHQVVSFALVYPLIGTAFLLLDYMAVKECYRGKRIGSALTKALVKKFCSNGEYLVLEVEDAEFGRNKAQRRRRIEFYKKQGAKKMIGVKYILPPLAGNTPTQMIMMILPEYNQRTIDGLLVKRLIAKIYEELYNLGGKDPLVTRSLSSVPRVVKLS